MLKSNRSIPPVSVVPILVYPDVREAVAWLSEVFGFVERTRIGDDHRSQLSIGQDGAVIIADVREEHVPPSPGSATHFIRVRVEDADAMHEQVQAGISGRRGRILEAPADRPFGERDFTVEDLAGHRWQFAETIGDVAPEEYGCTTVSPWPTTPA